MNLISLSRNDKRIDNRPAFVIDISREGNKAKIRGYEHSDSLQTASQYEEVYLDDSRISQYNLDVVRLLNRANRGGIVTRDILTSLKSAGQSLYDEIFTIGIKEKLNATRSSDLILTIDDHSVEIPWELFYDGHSFLCLRFNMGRVVRTRQSLYGAKTRKLSPPLSMFILANPKDDLESASREGTSIRDRLGSLENSILVEGKFKAVNLSLVLDKIRNYDILHYAGHSDYNPQRPDQSGWLLKDGKFTAAEIMKMKGAPMPSLVFANSCSSGQTSDWKIDDNCMNQVFGLANAFLLTGVRHYIGTFRKILDKTGSCFATAFYDALARQKPVGEALRLARQEVISEYGEETIVWASYMLYGDPGVYYTGPRKGEVLSPEIAETGADGPKSQPGSGLLRSSEQKMAPHSVPQSYSKLTVFSGVIVLALFMAAGGIYISAIDNQDRVTPVKQETERALSVKERLEEKVIIREEYEQIDAMIDDLEKRYQENRTKFRGEVSRDEWTSRTLVVTFLPFKVFETRASGWQEIILNRVTQRIKQEKRIQVVERAIITKILAEQRISTSELADPANVLRIGKLTGARFIVTGTLISAGDKSQLILNLTDVETTSIINASSYDFQDSKDARGLADRIVTNIEKALTGSFPFRGKIVSITGEGVIINIGKNVGMEKGIRLRVLREKNIAGHKKQIPGMIKKVETGSLEIRQVYERYSYCAVLSKKEEFEEGQEVTE